MAVAARGARILVVDDDPAFTEVVTEVLTDEGYAVRPCTRAEEALAAVRAEPPDLVLLDIHLPGPGTLDGLDIAQHLASDRRTRAVPVLLVTGVAPSERGPWADLLARQGQRVLFKPFGLADLLRAVEQALLV